jgi:hypothetical protein
VHESSLHLHTVERGSTFARRARLIRRPGQVPSAQQGGDSGVQPSSLQSQVVPVGLMDGSAEVVLDEGGRQVAIIGWVE